MAYDTRVTDLPIETLRQMTASERLRLCLEMSEAARKRELAAIREQHPEFSEEEVIREFVWIAHGIRLPSRPR